MVLLLGDRYEFFNAINCIFEYTHCSYTWWRITEGAIDDMLRHSITKLVHIHFTSTKIYKKRVIQMGEQPNQFLI